jgi:hypothetical protein
MRSLFFVAAVVCAVAPARAATRLDLGADHVLDGGPEFFSLTLSVDGPVTRAVSLGGRFGALITSTSSAGVPLDLFLRVSPGRSGVYLQGLVGPWILFDDAVRAHGAFGFGIALRSLEIGGEVGWLSGLGRAMLGVRLGFRI